MGDKLSKNLRTTYLQSEDRQSLYGRDFGLRGNQCEVYISGGVTDPQVDYYCVGILGSVSESMKLAE